MPPCRYVNTTACRSAISFIDGDAGILRYRGYPIEQLAERSSFLEVRPSALQFAANSLPVSGHLLRAPSLPFFSSVTA